MTSQTTVRKYDELQKCFAHSKEWPFTLKRLNSQQLILQTNYQPGTYFSDQLNYENRFYIYDLNETKVIRQLIRYPVIIGQYKAFFFDNFVFMWNAVHAQSLYLYLVFQEQFVLFEEFQKDGYGQIFFLEVKKHQNLLAQLEVTHDRVDQMIVNFFRIEKNDSVLARTIASKIPLTKLIKTLHKLTWTSNHYYVDTYIQRNTSDIYIASIKLTTKSFRMKLIRQLNPSPFDFINPSFCTPESLKFNALSQEIYHCDQKKNYYHKAFNFIWNKLEFDAKRVQVVHYHKNGVPYVIFNTMECVIFFNMENGEILHNTICSNKLYNDSVLVVKGGLVKKKLPELSQQRKISMVQKLVNFIDIFKMFREKNQENDENEVQKVNSYLQPQFYHKFQIDIEYDIIMINKEFDIIKNRVVLEQ